MEVLNVVVRMVIYMAIPLGLTGSVQTLKEMFKNTLGGNSMGKTKIVYTDQIREGITIWLKDGIIIVGTKTEGNAQQVAERSTM